MESLKKVYHVSDLLFGKFVAERDSNPRILVMNVVNSDVLSSLELKKVIIYYLFFIFT